MLGNWSWLRVTGPSRRGGRDEAGKVDPEGPCKSCRGMLAFSWGDGTAVLFERRSDRSGQTGSSERPLRLLYGEGAGDGQD